jgi:uncharacterized protein YndB with AHSA1/START domain
MPLDVERTSPTTLKVTRRFAAPPEKVFEAHVDPALIPRWMTGPGGWSMPVCINDARPGGAFRYEWRGDESGQGFSATGEFLEVERPRRIVHVERMHLGPDGPDPTPDNRCETLFEPDGAGGTRFTLTMSLPSPEALDAMVATGMTDGMEVSYAQLDALVRDAA